MRWIRPLLILCPAAFALLLFWPVLAEGRVFFWHDVSIAYMPLRKFATEAIRAGRLPFWAPGIACGFPLLGEGQAAVFYPLSALAYLGVPYYHAYSWAVAAQCFLAALGTVLLGRQLGLGWLAATYAGLAFGYSGYFVSKVVFLTVLQSGAWLPWLLLCLLAGLHSGRWSWFVAGATVLALSLLGGHPQIVFYELLAALLLALWYLLSRSPTTWWRRCTRAVGGTALTIAGGASLAALQLLPTLALTRFAATRTAPDVGLLRSLGLRPHDLAFFVHPYLFGSHAENNYWGQDHYFEVCAYAGGLTLLLALVAVFLRRLPLRHKGYWLLLGLFGLFMALAALNPLYEVLPSVPIFNLFRGPARYLLLTALSLSLLAGGLVQALAGSRRRTAGQALAIWTLAALLLCGALIGALHVARPQVIAALHRALPEVTTPGDQAAAYDKAEAKWQFLTERLGPRDPIWVAFLGGLILAGLVGLGASRGEANYRLVASVLLAVLTGQLYLFGRDANPTAPATYYTAPPRSARLFHQERAWGREYGDPATEWQAFAGRGYPGWASGDLTPFWEEREVLRRNRAGLYDVPAAHAFYTLLPERQVRLLDQLVPAGLRGRPDGAGAPLQILRMLGVRLLIAPPGLRSPWIRPLLQTPRYALYRVTAVLPSAWLPLQTVACADQAEALRRLTALEFRPEETALVEGLSPAQAAKLSGGWSVVRQAASEPEHLVWQTDSSSPAFLVLNMSYNPHWRATVNGESVPVYRANYVQCGVVIPPGKNRVEAVYREDEFWLGLRVTQVTAVSLAALLLVMGIVEVARHRKNLTEKALGRS